MPLYSIVRSHQATSGFDANESSQRDTIIVFFVTARRGLDTIYNLIDVAAFWFPDLLVQRCFIGIWATI